MKQGFDMNALEPGMVWDLPGGKRVEVLQRAFIWGGKRWVAVDDHDFDEPRLMLVARFEGGTSVA